MCLLSDDVPSIFVDAGLCFSQFDLKCNNHNKKNPHEPDEFVMYKKIIIFS